MIDKKIKEFRQLRGLSQTELAKLMHVKQNTISNWETGVPDAYIIERGGLGNDRTLKDVYRHTVAGARKEMTDKINDYFTRISHGKKKKP